MVLYQREQRERIRDTHEEDYDYSGKIKSFHTWDIGFFDPDGRGLFVETKANEEVCQNVFVFTDQI